MGTLVKRDHFKIDLRRFLFVGHAVQVSSYNGFDHNQRMRALYWLRKEYAAGRRHPPTLCDACGQTEGVLEAHSEDYSAPYGDHIGRFGLCYRCHMAIHCRYRHPGAWKAYKQNVREGRIFHPIGRNFTRFIHEFTRQGRGVPFKQGPPRAHTVLDDLK